MGTQMLPYRFTVEDFHRMSEVGILGPEDRVELVRGKVVVMAAIGVRHAACVTRMNELLVLRAHHQAVITTQNPVRLASSSELQPDLMLLRRREDHYAGTAPGPEDVLLVIEVSDTTLAYDRNTKVPLYAETGIPEVWVVDLNASAVVVFRDRRSGGYAHPPGIVRPGATLSPQALPAVSITADEILV